MQSELEPNPPRKNLWGCIGKFYIPRSWFVAGRGYNEMTSEKYVQMKRIFEDMIVLECEFQVHSDIFLYVAISPLFSELPQEKWCSNETIPEYAVRLGNDGRVIFDTRT